MAVERLQKILARAGVASRRASEEIIQQGRVTVNGQKATLGMSADPDTDEIRLDGERLTLPETHEYIILNKPRGIISDEDVKGEHENARDLIPLGGHLYPVGRLDLDSEGLMLFTNDGDLAHKLTHPRYEHPKTYRVLVEGSPSEDVLNQWRNGVWLEGKPTYPADVRKIIKTRKGTILDVTLREGRKRQIRKVAAKLGHPVISLVRTGLGPLTLGDLPVGAWRRLTDDEVAALRRVRQTRPHVRRSTGGRAQDRRRDEDRPSRTGRPPGRRSGEGRQRGEHAARQEGASRHPRRDRFEPEERSQRRQRTEKSEGSERAPRRGRTERDSSVQRDETPRRGRVQRREGSRGEQSERSRRPNRREESQRPRRRTPSDESTRPPRSRRPPGRTSGQQDKSKQQGPRNKPKRGAES